MNDETARALAWGLGKNYQSVSARYCKTLALHILELEAQAVKLQKFKDWVHSRLDQNGVPYDPNPEKTARTGCRVGRRFEFIEGRIAELEAQVGRMRRRATAARNELDNPAYRHLDCRPYLPYEALEDIAAGCPDDEGTTGSQTEEVKDG